MGFKEVHESLQQLFPQIDARVLRAVSIEHNKDVDAAVVAVLEEIIPFFTKRSAPNSPLSQNLSVSESSEGTGDSSVRTQALAQLQNGDNVLGKPSEAFNDTYDGHHEGDENTAELTFSAESPAGRMQMKANVHSQGESLVLIDANRMESHQLEMSAGPQTEGTAPADKCPESGINNLCGSIRQPKVGTFQDLDMCDSQKMDCIQEKEGIDDESAHDISFPSSGSSAQLVETPDMRGCNLDKSELPLSTDTATSNVLNTEDDLTLTATMSTEIRISDVIEEIVADARNNKKKLFLEMESVINLMKQVEFKEQAAEQAKTEATTGGTDLLNQAEELKRMLQHAKEANNMHAGEVYGEKAILETELRELQSRACSLSDKRDVSLAILDEIRQSLEARLSAAENEIKSAELRKLEKEEVARKFLAEQELNMEKVVEESKLLRQQAEDNAKLQEFLLDRGRVVDTLQGEIAVICQDVKLLKEKFDQHVPLGKSLFSSQTSFMLASSASSLNSLVPDQVETVAVEDSVQLETENNRDHEKVPDGVTVRENCKELVEDDGWEFFDSSELNALST